jgi:hypothetical protein
VLRRRRRRDKEARSTPRQVEPVAGLLCRIDRTYAEEEEEHTRALMQYTHTPTPIRPAPPLSLALGLASHRTHL